MKIKGSLRVAALVVCLMMTMAVCASAAEVEFEAVDTTQYYTSTEYQTVYGARYNYGAPNVADYRQYDLPYGTASATAIGAMEKYTRYLTTGSTVQYGITSWSDVAVTPVVYQRPAYTSPSGMVRGDGSIGTLRIPSLNITMKVWDGDFNSATAKGLWHFSSSSGWDGNVGIFGHNRGTRYAIGKAKDLKAGDTITYETVYGTRTYEVSSVETISNTDWSRLQGTADNRITLVTCLADHPEVRVCVQAVEKSFEP